MVIYVAILFYWFQEDMIICYFWGNKIVLNFMFVANVFIHLLGNPIIAFLGLIDLVTGYSTKHEAWAYNHGISCWQSAAWEWQIASFWGKNTFINLISLVNVFIHLLCFTNHRFFVEIWHQYCQMNRFDMIFDTGNILPAAILNGFIGIRSGSKFEKSNITKK